jgi:uncharacterized delta-60 repeat protein
MGVVAKARGLTIGIAVLLAVTAGAALAADPTDGSFGTNGVVEIEARTQTGPRDEQVGGIVDLEQTGDGKLLAAVHSITRGGHYFAVARVNPDGSLDTTFGEGGFTPRLAFSRAHEIEEEGALQAEAVAVQKNGDIVLAGYLDAEGAFAPALARFTPQGTPDPTFGNGGKVVPHRPTSEGRRLFVAEYGGERLHDVEVEANGDIIGVGGNNEETGQHRDPNPTAFVIAYGPDGKIDRSFGDGGRFKVKAPRKNAYTGFTEVKALPSGKLLVSGYVRNQLVLYRLTGNGKLDRSFGGGDGKVTVGRATSSGGGGFIRAPFAVGPGGRIVLCGATFPAGRNDTEQPLALVRLLSNGGRDKSFAGGSIYMEQTPRDKNAPLRRKHVQFFTFQPEAIAVDGKGRIVVTGGELALYARGQQEAGYEYFSARRFLPSGRRDKSFGEGGVFPTNPPGSQSYGRAAVTEGTGQVVAGGSIQIERGGGNGPGNTAMLLTRYR